MDEPQTKRAPNVIDCYLNALKTARPLSAVMADLGSVPLTPAWVGRIKNVRDISKVVLLLNQKLPARELQHLKRVRERHVLLCPAEYLNEMSIEDYLCKCDVALGGAFDSYEVRDVPKEPPKLKRQYESAREFWPCNFHPDQYLERLSSGHFFTDSESLSHRKYMVVALLAAKWFGAENAAVVVDPSMDSVVAIAHDDRTRHPMKHAAMLAIDNVAGTQNGGAWRAKMDDDALVDAGLLGHLGDVKFGYRQCDDKATDGPYLCTGYDVYIMREPCVMCAMALVHARAKRIFFAIDNEVDGALKTRVMLQTVASLNHRYEVFTGFL